MNYFTHAIRFLDRPWFLAGLAVPDWLSVVNRSVRIRRRDLLTALPELTGDELELALGIRQHIEDDRWFHGTRAFHEVTGQLGRAFREVEGGESFRGGFLGHVLTELLLDAVLIEPEPEALSSYYEVLERVEPRRVEELVSRLATRDAAPLATFITLYRRERFLADYLDDQRLWRRLNQVLERVQLPTLGPQSVEVIREGRQLVRERASELLPAERFAP